MEAQHEKRSRVPAVLLIFSFIMSLCFLVFAFRQKTGAEKAQNYAVSCLEEQVKVKEELKKAQDYSAALQYRLQAIEKDLADTKRMNEALLKRIK
jgi:uncharacterized protein YlxW (UPF0749 family)